MGTYAKGYSGGKGDYGTIVPGVTVYKEPFNDLSKFAVGSLTIIGGGRNGTGGNLNGSGNNNYFLPTSSLYATVGMAYKVSDIAAVQRLLYSMRDLGGNDICTVRTNTDGSASLYLGTTNVLATSAAGLISPGVWNYYEAQIYEADVGGFWAFRINNVLIGSGTNTDTKLAGNYGAIANIFFRGPGTAQNAQFDDMYVYLTDKMQFLGDMALS